MWVRPKGMRRIPKNVTIQGMVRQRAGLPMQPIRHSNV